MYGSDTTAPSLIMILYLLARHPCDMDSIRQELSEIDIDDVKAVGALPHLNGAINEAMRLLPAVLTFVTRVTPEEGLRVGETFIPGNVKIAAPRYSIGRRKSQVLFDTFLNQIECPHAHCCGYPGSRICLGPASPILPSSMV